MEVQPDFEAGLNFEVVSQLPEQAALVANQPGKFADLRERIGVGRPGLFGREPVERRFLAGIGNDTRFAAFAQDNL